MDALVIRAGHDAAVEGIQEQGAHQAIVLDPAVNKIAGRGVELVDDVVVAARENILGIVGELDRRKPAVLGGEVLDGDAGLEVPELGNAVAARRDEEVAAELDGVDGAAVALERADTDARLAVPDLDHGVLGARDDVLVVEADVEHAGLVAAQAVHGHKVGAGDVPDDAGVVRGARDHDLGVVLQAQDGGVVVVRGHVVEVVAGRGAVERGVADDTLGALLHGRRRVCAGAVVGPAVDAQALVRGEVPDADGAVARARDGLGLVELAAVDAVRVAVEIDGGRRAGPPAAVDDAAGLEHLLPVLGGRRVRASHAAHAAAAHVDGRGRDVHLGLELAQEDVAPDVRRRGVFVPAVRHALGAHERGGVEVGQHRGGQLGGQALEGVEHLFLVGHAVGARNRRRARHVDAALVVLERAVRVAHRCRRLPAEEAARLLLLAAVLGGRPAGSSARQRHLDGRGRVGQAPGGCRPPPHAGQALEGEGLGGRRARGVVVVGVRVLWRVLRRVRRRVQQRDARRGREARHGAAAVLRRGAGRQPPPLAREAVGDGPQRARQRVGVRVLGGVGRAQGHGALADGVQRHARAERLRGGALHRGRGRRGAVPGGGLGTVRQEGRPVMHWEGGRRRRESTGETKHTRHKERMRGQAHGRHSERAWAAGRQESRSRRGHGGQGVQQKRTDPGGLMPPPARGAGSAQHER